MKAINIAQPKLVNSKPPTRLAVISRRNALTTMAKKPNVKIVNGNVKTVKIGLMIAFNIDNTNAANNAETQLSTRNPEVNIIDKTKKLNMFVANRTIKRI